MNEAHKIISQLKDKGFTKWAIAKKIHVTWHTIHMWEKEVFNPSNINMLKLKELLILP